MNDKAVYYRNIVSHTLYSKVMKPILFRFDPENVHDHMIKLGKVLGNYKITRNITSGFFNYENKSLEQKIMGLHFKNPIGLSAGFDKNAELIKIIPSVGFGFEEVGSITGEACAGNPKPRLWRLKDSKSIAVYYGLKNNGCEKISDNLDEELKGFKLDDSPLGISVAMTNCNKNLKIKNAVLDYVKAFKRLEDKASYITVNISCPNTLSDQPFRNPINLDYLFDLIDEVPTKKPIFVKLSPDSDKKEIDEILNVISKHRIHGIICSNLTKNRDLQTIVDKNVPSVGGLSGKVVDQLSDDQISYIYNKTAGKYVIVGSGGIFTTEDAYRKIRKGASLLQLITGMLFEGPQLIGEINRGLVELLKKDGFNNISEAVGADFK